MTYAQFAGRAWPLTILALVAAVAAPLLRRTEVPAGPAAPPAAPRAETRVVTVTQMVYRPVDLAMPRPTEPAPGARIRPPEAREASVAPVWISPGPTATNAVSEEEQRRWLAQFDRAMDREFARLEQRERSSADTNDLAMVARLRDRLAALDDLWGRADRAASTDERIRLQGESQRIMAEIIQLGRADRNQRLTRLAAQYGVVTPEAVAAFITDVDRAFVDTDLDWAALFNRGVMVPAGSAPVSPGP